jgi:hypothetical protein
MHFGELVYEGKDRVGVTHGFVQLHPSESFEQVPAAMKLGCGAMFLAGLPPGRIPADSAGDAANTTTTPARVRAAASRRATSGALS